MKAGHVCQDLTAKWMPEALRAGSAIAQQKFDEFFSRALEAQARAEAVARGPARRRFRIAGVDVEFRLAHPGLAALFCAALAHIEIAVSGEPDFTFHIWDQASSGIGAPPPCWQRDELLGYGEVTALSDSERYLQVAPDRPMVSAAYRPARKAAVWLRSLGHVAEWERAAPLITLINWVASGYGYFNVHAACVGRPAGGVLIIGRSGAGKSHTAIACLDSDLFYAADDHCLFGTDGRPMSASLYSTAKLYASDLHRFPILQRRQSDAVRTQEGKSIFFLNAIAPDRLSRGFPIRAVVLPHYSGERDTVVKPAPASAALLLLGPFNVLRWPSGGRTTFAGLASALRSLPCFHLETGTDIAQIPKVIGSLLDSVPMPKTDRGLRP
jgi:hypothetical protein